MQTRANEKMNKDIAKAVKESQKVSAKAMADAQVELSRIGPVIAKIAAEAVIDPIEMVQLADIEAKLSKAQAVQAIRADALVKLSEFGFSRTMPRIEKQSGVFVMKGIPTITVSAEPCSVKIIGWDKNEVQYRVVQHIEPRRPEPLKISETHTESSVSISIDEPKANNDLRFYGDGQRTVVEIYVPRKSNLKITANGELRVEGVNGNVELNGSESPINVRDLEGKLRVNSSDGMIRVIGFRGEIEARSLDGSIGLEGVFSKLVAKATDGTVTLTLAEDTAADLEANCANIKGDGIPVTRVSSGEDEALSKYRIGRGGNPFRVETDGDIFIRGAASLRDTN
jgi:hypothetical protein